MDVLTWVGLIAAGVKVVSVIKQIWPSLKAWQIQVIAWLVAMVMVLVGAQIDVIKDTEINGMALGLMNIKTQLGLGFIFGSAGSLVGADVLSAIDRNKTTAV